MSDRAADLVFHGLLLILPLAALIARRPPLKRTLLLIATWIGIFVVGLLVVGQRERVGSLLGKNNIEGRETRVAAADSRSINWN